MHEDKPKTLGNPQFLSQRLEKIWMPNIAPLTEFVLDLRESIGAKATIPFFDPLDAGLDANVLFLLEAPGPKAVNSGFVSRNNPDETAKNIFLLMEEAHIQRTKSILWNIVPWYIGSEKRIRPANSDDIKKGSVHLEKLLNLLPKLQAIVLLGKKAQKAEERILAMFPDLVVFNCPHPSPMYVNRNPNNRQIILEKFISVKNFLDG